MIAAKKDICWHETEQKYICPLEIKKNIAADIERLRPVAFMLGLVVVLAFLAVLLEMSFAVSDDMMNEESTQEPDFEMMLSHKEADNMIAVPQQNIATVSPDKVEVASQQIEGWEDKLLQDIEKTAKQPPHTKAEKLEKVKETIMPDEPIDYNKLEQLPQFPGGMTALVQWLNENLHYPPVAQRNKKEGTVEVQFIINVDGSVSDAQLVSKCDYNLGKEVMRVISMMPRWEKSGEYHGRPCRTLFAIPIVFDI